jgi:NUMOD3 motif
MDEERKYYVYMYLREDGTPYYVGKGTGDRAYCKNKITKPPKDSSRIVFYAENLTEEEAFAIEIDQIKKYGRVDNNTGILRNLTNGGEGSSGKIFSEETRAKISDTNKKLYASPEIRAKMSVIAKEAMNSPEIRAKMSVSIKEAMNNPEVKAKISAASKESNNRPEVKAKFIEMMSRPESRVKRIASIKEAMNRPEVRAKISAASKKMHAKKQAEKLAAQANLQSFLEEPSTQLDTVAEKQQS